MARLDYELESLDVKRPAGATPRPRPMQPSLGAKQTEADGDKRYTWRFIHLTFQEFFVAQRLLSVVEEALRKKSFWTYSTDVVKKIVGDKLYDSWYREVLLLMASCAEDATLAAMLEYLLVDADNTGANEHLVMLMLDERRDHPTAHATATTVRQRQEVRLLGSVVEALCHPFASLRETAATQMLSLGLDVTSVAGKLQVHMRSMQDDWFRSVNLMTSLIQLRANATDALHQQDAELAEAIKDSLLGHTDLDVVAAAAAGLGALGVRNGRLIFALFDIRPGPAGAVKRP
jgi:hypothetical protein